MVRAPVDLRAGKPVQAALAQRDSRATPPEWLIDGLVPEDGLVVLYGEPTAGKSFLALDWGLSVATGVAWLGHSVKQGELVYIYAEGVRGLRRRAEAWLQRNDAPDFRALPVAVSIPDPKELSEFVKAVRSVGNRPRLIIIDTLARNFGEGNESIAQDMNAFVRGCDDLRARFPDATILVVHHPGKDHKKGARGSVALKGAVDAEFELTRSGDAITLKNEKQKDGEEAQPIPLELARVTLLEGSTSRVIRPTGGPIGAGLTTSDPPPDPRTVETYTGMLQVLAGFGSGGAKLQQWREAADCANDTFYKSRDRLVQAGKVIHGTENARYIAMEAIAGPGPGVVQDGSNSLEVQKVSPEVPLWGDWTCWTWRGTGVGRAAARWRAPRTKAIPAHWEGQRHYDPRSRPTISRAVLEGDYARQQSGQGAD
jgi:hypothetical protein